jgi:5-methylcytosine-specific restriction endonuclease McrA
LRVTEEMRRTYRCLERLYARYRPSNKSFLAYCCSELLAVWAHARPPVAYASVYARDGFRCANPVCRSRHVTPHHVVFRSRGGADEDVNVTSLCLDCHLEGAHEGRMTVTGSAPDLLWVVGKSGHTVVQGRRRVRAPLPVPAAIAGA